MTKHFFVYIITNFSNTVLYTGTTNNLIRRVFEHKQKFVSSFSSKYKISKLVYYEIFDSALEAIAREKQIKGGSRLKKVNLVKSINPKFLDLYQEIIK